MDRPDWHYAIIGAVFVLSTMGAALAGVIGTICIAYIVS